MISARELEPDLRKPFSLDLWSNLLQELLPGLSLFSAAREIPLNTKTERAVATSLQQIGVARLADSKGVGLFVIQAEPKVDLTRNRAGLRQLSARWIDQTEIHAALTLSFQPDTQQYRLTYAARESVFTPDLQLVTQETATRRFTFVLGEGERRRTAAQRLSLLADRRPELTLDDITNAFSVDKLNKEFFADFCRARAELSKEIHASNRLDETAARVEAQTLLNRLLFLYFLQRKGWLNRDRDYLASAFARFDEREFEATTFYSKFLMPLFGIVSTEWRQREKVTVHLDETDPRRHDLPFLNGGLFADELGSEEDDVRRRRKLRIRNSVFRCVFTDLFERYNFTIHEDSERDAEVAVDPEMLGRIFEELVLTGEESESGGKTRRHDTGSHYTPRPIVRYLCREGLAAWLADRPSITDNPDARKIIDGLLSLDASVGIDDNTWDELRGLFAPTEARKILDDLFELRACDPAVGSGAFPVGLLHELVNVARLLDARTRGKDPDEVDSDWLYNNKKRLIERCLYGVDVQGEALEICKLRLWLSLMVDHQLGVDPDQCDRRSFASALRRVEPLPNLEFKIRRANALIDMIRGQRLQIDAPAKGPHTQRILNQLTSAKHDFYNATTAKEKRQLRFTIYKATADLAHYELSWLKRQHAELGLDDSPEIRARLLEIQKAEHALGAVLERLDLAKKRKAAEQEEALERLRDWWEDAEAPTFVWYFDFAEVFHRSAKRQSSDQLLPDSESVDTGGSRGFDLQIGNPPYIRIQVLKRIAPQDAEWYREHYRSAGKGNYDLYVVFIERSLKLLNERGQLAFICPHKFFNAQYGEPLRALIAKCRYLRHVVHFGDQQIFPGATNYVCLLFLARGGAESSRFVQADELRKWLATFTAPEAEIGKRRITPADWNFVVGKNANLFERLDSFEARLEQATERIFQGIKTSGDKVYIVEELSRRDGLVRVYSRETDCEHDLDAALLHPLVKGGDSHAFSLERTARRILFPYQLSTSGSVSLVPEDVFQKKFRATWRYLEKNYEFLANREDGRMRNAHWYGYIYPKALDVMSLPKLFTPDLAPRAAFSFDETGEVFFTGGAAGGYGLLAKPPFTARFLLGLLNSRASDFFHHRVAAVFRGGWFSYEARFIRNIPVPPSDSSQRASVEHLVDWLLFLHRQPTVRAATQEHPRDPELAIWFERWVNALVYELFFPDELHTRGLNFFPLTEDFPPSAPADNAEAAATLATLRSTVEKLSAPGHVLRRALDQLQTLDLVRIIEGGA